MAKYLFLIAWMDGSGACADNDTDVHKQDDLMPQYQKGNEHVFAVEISGAPNEEIASAYGYKNAFFANYTAHDTLSTIQEISDDWEHPDPDLVATEEV